MAELRIKMGLMARSVDAVAADLAAMDEQGQLEPWLAYFLERLVDEVGYEAVHVLHALCEVWSKGGTG